MTRLGADPDQLRHLARELARAADGLDGAARRGDRSLRAVPWEGPDADALRAEWERRHRPGLAGAAARCRTASRLLLDHAEAQARASSATGTGTATAAHPTGGAAATTGGAGATAASTALPAAPRRTLRADLDVEASGALVGAGTATWVELEDLGAGRWVVTLGDRTGAGVGGGARGGAWAAADGRELGLSGRIEVAATATIAERRRYEVAADQVEQLLDERAVDRALHATPLTTPLVWARAAFGDSLLDRPVRTDRLVGVELGAVAGGSVPGGRDTASAARGGAEAALQVGTGHGDGGTSLVVEARGTAAGVLSGGLSRALAHGSHAGSGGSTLVRWEAFTSGPRAGEVHLRWEATGGPGTTRLDAVLRPEAGRRSPPPAIRSATQQAARGDVAGAGATLARLHTPADRLELRWSEGRTATRRYGGGVGSAVGLEVAGASSTTTWRRSG